MNSDSAGIKYNILYLSIKYYPLQIDEVDYLPFSKPINLYITAPDPLLAWLEYASSVYTNMLLIEYEH